MRTDALSLQAVRKVYGSGGGAVTALHLGHHRLGEAPLAGHSGDVAHHAQVGGLLNTPTGL